MMTRHSDDDEVVRTLGNHMRKAIPSLLDRHISEVAEIPVAFRVAEREFTIRSERVRSMAVTFLWTVEGDGWEFQMLLGNVPREVYSFNGNWERFERDVMLLRLASNPS